MDEVLSSTLQSAVFGRLDYLDRLAREGDESSRAALADTEITRLTRAWRCLLVAHQPDERGRCPQCSGRRRSRRRPCSVWNIAHQHLIAADGIPVGRAGRHAAATGRSTVAVLGAS
ncbi:hypothetical protein [Amycolatopsis sp. CA-126428]|uniref:hypothetical protein n=1 Tax=Amycolatopsis sp. CA-126428 TaxID=2073158 RepID=UPI0011B0E15A|nr:hypothetical protein [Amycolatopsis sp. CA-126428]